MEKSPEEVRESELREIRKEKAMVQHRMERFQEALDNIKAGNRALLKSVGLTSFEEVEKLMTAGGIHPGGVEMFRRELAARGKELPDFVRNLPVPEIQTDQVSPASAGVKKKKRVKIRL